MIVSNMSGIRLLPFFKVDLRYIRRMHSKANNAWQFDKAPSFELVTLDTIAAPVVKLVNFHNQTEANVTTSPTALAFNGTNYSIHTAAEGGTTKGLFYYKATIGSDVYYSPVFKVGCSANVEVRYQHTCKSVLTGTKAHTNKLLITDAELVPAGVEGNQAALQLADGSLEVTNSHVRSVWRVEKLASRELFERLEHIKQFDNITIFAYGKSYSVKKSTFKVEGGQPNGSLFSAILTFQVDEIDEIPHCECPDFVDDGEVVNGGGTSTDEACPNLAVSIDSSSLPTLSANVSGSPTNSFTTKWYRDGVFFSSSNQISAPNQNAIWELRVKMEGCVQKTATYTYVNVCNIFRIIEEIIAGTLSANYENIPTGATVSAVVKDATGAQVSAALPYTPTESGVYTIEATAGPCTKAKAVFVSADSTTCVHTAQIAQVGSEFQGSVTNPPTGTATYLWEYIAPDNTITQLATTQNITPTQTGVYIFSATIDGCTSRSDGRLFVTHTRVEIINPITVITDNRWRYEVFTQANSSFDDSFKRVEVSQGILPDISGFTGTPEEIARQVGERIIVHLNQNKLEFKNPTTFVSEFSIDNTTNELIVHNNLGQWDVLSIFFLQDLQ